MPSIATMLHMEHAARRTPVAAATPESGTPISSPLAAALVG